MTDVEWEFIKPRLPERWRNFALRQGWPDVLFGDGIAFNESRDGWLCRSPVFIRDRTYAWYFFGFSGEVYCFRALDPVVPRIEFVGCQPPRNYEEFKAELLNAFDVFGFYGLIGVEKISFKPAFPES